MSNAKVRAFGRSARIVCAAMFWLTLAGIEPDAGHDATTMNTVTIDCLGVSRACRTSKVPPLPLFGPGTQWARAH